MVYKQEIGKSGEEIATQYLKREKGYTIIERNFRCKQGEIDIIAIDREEIVFIEVKTRSNQNYGRASEAVNQQKRKHLIKAIQYYIYKRNLEESFIRMDIVEIYMKNKRVTINHIKQAIE